MSFPTLSADSSVTGGMNEATLHLKVRQNVGKNVDLKVRQIVGKNVGLKVP